MTTINSPVVTSPYKPPFDDAEFARRLAAVKQRMSDRGIDLLLIADPANMNFLTGYDGWSFYVHQMVAVALEAEQPMWIGRRQDAPGARESTWLDDGEIVGYPDHYVHSTERHPMDFVARVMVDRGWAKGTVAVESDAYYYTAAADAALRRGLPNCRFVDAALLVNWVRAIKSEAEIALMRQAARIAERAMQTAVDVIAPGVRQCDAVAEITAAQIRGLPEFGGEYAAIVPLLPTGTASAAPHLTWTDRPFETGAGTIIELAGCRRRYHCPMARTVYLGTPPQKWHDLAEMVVEGIGYALEAAKPGNTCADIEAAWRKALEPTGLVKESRLGYPTGVNYPPDWGEHTMSLRPGDTTVLQPNMTFHLIPGMWLDDWGIEISECIRITETGAEPFCGFERRLFVRD